MPSVADAYWFSALPGPLSAKLSGSNGGETPSDVEEVASASVDVPPRRTGPAQPVLEEVVVRRDAAVLTGGLERVAVAPAAPRSLVPFWEVEVPELDRGRQRVLVAGVLAGEEQLAALVHVVARVDHLLDREPGEARAAGLGRHPGEEVVARVPDDMS